MYDYSKLIGRIIERYGTRASFASAVGVSKTYLSKILNGRTYLRHKDIGRWAEILDIPSEKIGEYFFTRKVHETAH